MSASPARPLWGPQQREWLQALGHAPLTLVGSGASADAGSPRPEPAGEGASPQPAGETAPALSVPPIAAQPAVDALDRALVRATGLPAAEAALALQSLGVDPAELRGNPAAKRRLWSRLRQLRRSRPA